MQHTTTAILLTAALLSARVARASTACCQTWGGPGIGSCVLADACSGPYGIPVTLSIADAGGLPCGAATCDLVSYPTCCQGDCREPDPALCAGPMPSCCSGACTGDARCKLAPTTIGACCDVAGSIVAPPLPAGWQEWQTEWDAPVVGADADAPEAAPPAAGDDAGALDMPPTLLVAPGCRCGVVGGRGGATGVWGALGVGAVWVGRRRRK